MTSNHSTTPPSAGPSNGTGGPGIPVRWLLILITALLTGLTFGWLTYMQTGTVPAALLAGLSAGGAAVLGLNQIVD